MILADTSVWIRHLRLGDAEMARALPANEILVHDFVIGELACGRLGNRDPTLAWLGDLPRAPLAETQEVLDLLERHRLYGLGLGWVDAHLLASSLLAGCSLWTLDRRLQAAAASLIPANPPAS
jgi:predicted nucleic acid-binding protein